MHAVRMCMPAIVFYLMYLKSIFNKRLKVVSLEKNIFSIKTSKFYSYTHEYTITRLHFNTNTSSSSSAINTFSIHVYYKKPQTLNISVNATDIQSLY